jgi:hypothetical protein
MRQDQLKKVREKKEATKIRKLNKKTINKLTQEMAKVRAQETKQLEGIHKDLMKK